MPENGELYADTNVELSIEGAGELLGSFLCHDRIACQHLPIQSVHHPSGLTASLKGCHKLTYKWSDMRKLMNYGLSDFEYQNVWKEISLPSLPVRNAVPENGELYLSKTIYYPHTFLHG